MVKRIGLVVSVCLTAFLISSCSDGGTQSGYEANLSKRGAMGSGPATRLITSVQGQSLRLSRATQCDWTLTSDLDGSKKKYLDHLLHKAIAKSNANPNTGYGFWNASTAAIARSAALTNCQSNYGTCTVVDVDEEQCHSGSGTYIVAAVGYTNKYADLLAAYNANSGGQSKSLWGKNHYCNSGKNEGRTYSGLSSTSCSASRTSTSTTSSTTSSSSYEGYVDKYADLLAAFNRVGGSKSNWGKNHYCNNGRVEGRTYSGLSASSCSSTTTTTTSSGNAYEGYVNKYADLLAAFNRVGGSKSNWGKNHYCNNGRVEGRTYSGLSASSCSSTTTTTTTTTTSIPCSTWGCGPYLCIYMGFPAWSPVPCSTSSSNSSTLCPDGSYVGGSQCRICPDGSYVGGSQCRICPDGSYVGGSQCRICPDGSYVAGSQCRICPDGSYVAGSQCLITPNGTYVGY